MSQTHEQGLQRGIICDYITDSPEDYETGRLAEPFGSPYDPIIPHATRALATNVHPISPAGKLEPVRRPSSDSLLPESNKRNFREGYLAQQFAAHRPVPEQVGLIGVPPDLSATTPDNQRAYNQHPQLPPHSSRHPCLYPSIPTCDRDPPYGANVNSCGPKTPHVPTIEQLLEGIYVPTWDQLDAASRQIKELYALRALLDPHGHQLRTHVPVQPNIPSEDHRIWGGPVPPASGNPPVGNVVDNGWNALGNFGRTYPSTRPHETQVPETCRVSPLCLGESRIPTPVTILNEPIVEGSLDCHLPEDEGVQYQLDPDEVSFNEVVEAWNRLEDIIIEVRARSDAFVYPPKIDFVPSYGLDNEPLVNRQSLSNKAFVRHWEFLYCSLDELNGMQPLSDRMASALRRAVKEVNYELDQVEEFATKLWQKEHQAKKQRFGRNVFSSEYDDDGWWCEVSFKRRV